jgi:divalent metal cation (Fe/Co/Zn/Cd) transporter
LHDKVLYADADMNKADWMSEMAAMVGILGIGFGLWWADAVAGALISLNILRDGWRNLSQVIKDLVDEVPTKVGQDEVDALPKRLEAALEEMDWRLHDFLVIPVRSPRSRVGR